MILGLQNAFGRSKRVFEHFLHFGSRKPSKNDSVYHYKNAAPKIGAYLRPKCTLGALGAPWVPWGPEAGWLAGWLAGKEGRGKGAEGSEVRASS